MKKIETIAIDSTQSLIMSVQMVFMLMLGASIFALFFGDSRDNGAAFTLAGMFTYIITLIIHELLHGLGFLLAGAKPKFGVGLAGVIPIAYATAKDNNKLGLKGMLFTAYLPFVAISIVCIPLGYMFPQYLPLIMVAFLGNFSGAIGDIWIASHLWKYLPYSKDVLVQDTKSGILVYSDDPRAIAIGKKATHKAINNKLNKRRSNFIKIWLGSAIVLTIIAAIIPILMVRTGFVGQFTLGYNEVFSIFALHIEKKGVIEMSSLNFFTPLLIGLCIAGLYSLLTMPHKQPRTSVSA